MIKKLLLIVCFALFFFSSNAQELILELGNSDMFTDIYTPEDAGKILIHQPQKLNNLLGRNIAMNKERKGFPGWRIQVFFDSDRNARQQAQIIKSRLMRAFYNTDVYLSYEDPYYSVRLGDFRSKHEAQRFLKKVENDYPRAHLVRDLIKLPTLDDE